MRVFLDFFLQGGLVGCVDLASAFGGPFLGEVQVGELAEALHGPQLFVDMTQVTFIDSTATSCLLHALEASEKLILRRSAQVERLLELSGLSDLFPAPE